MPGSQLVWGRTHIGQWPMLPGVDMPFRYERDEDQRCITVTVDGTFNVDDVIEVFARMADEGIWSYGVLYDVRSLTGLPSMFDLRRLAEVANRPGPFDMRRGPLAIVVADPALYGMACVYAALSLPMGRVEVFRDSEDAELWLLRKLEPVLPE